TCRRCKENHDQRSKRKLPVRIVTSPIDFVKQPESIKHFIGFIEQPESVEHTINFVEQSESVEQYSLEIRLNVNITSDIIAKNIATLIVAEIEGGNDYLW
ncbi:35846_t:CDS:2, partial [Racocetra persica]